MSDDKGPDEGLAQTARMRGGLFGELSNWLGSRAVGLNGD